MKELLRILRKELKANADETTKEGSQRFFKEKIKCYGIKTGVVVKIAKKYWKEVSELDKKSIFRLCEELYSSDYCEEAFVVSSWVPNMSDRFEKGDLKIFRRWIDKYINNWAKCDGFCNHSIGLFIEKYPSSLKEIMTWGRSGNRWMRRACAVSLIIPAKRGRLLKEVFKISDMLLLDGDDMVQKGYGWLLKEASRFHQKEVFDYVVKNKGRMPRTALRYAIELMPKALKIKAMQRSSKL